MIISRHDISTPTLYFHGCDYIKPRYIHPHPHMGLIIRTLYFHSRENLKWGWIYRNLIFSFPTIFGRGDYIVTAYFHPDSIWSGGDYIMTIIFSLLTILVRGWLYRDIILSLLIILVRGDYIVTWYSHPWQYLVRGWFYRDIIFSLLAIFGQAVIISWHYIFSPDIISWHYSIISDTTLESGTGGDYIWIFSLSKFVCAMIPVSLLISIYSPHETWGVGVIIFKHDTLFADETWCFGEYVNGLYQQSAMNKKPIKNHRKYKKDSLL